MRYDTQSTAQILGHADELLDSTAKGITEVQTALVQARANLKEARDATSKPNGDDASRRFRAGAVPCRTRQTLRRGPAAVAVRDDGHVNSGFESG